MACGCGENSRLWYTPSGTLPGQDGLPEWIPDWMNAVPTEKVWRWLVENGKSEIAQTVNRNDHPTDAIIAPAAADEQPAAERIGQRSDDLGCARDALNAGCVPACSRGQVCRWTGKETSTWFLIFPTPTTGEEQQR
jgi:hypothetical protein